MTKLPNPPLDCISRVRFAPAEGNCQFLAASWDGTVRLYDAGTRRLLGQHKQPLPILDAVFFEDSLKCVAAGLSKKVMLSASDWCAMGVVEVELATGLLPPAVPSNDAVWLNADGARSTALFLDFPWERLRAGTLRAPVEPGQADPLANARGGVALTGGGHAAGGQPLARAVLCRCGGRSSNVGNAGGTC
ncbi:BUB3.2 [Symbiodinium necroappetens]|uniref:BUB3.2 protein n=1 Tax=Symbiodinium necroappetens TaxID=1628268 RepID=A0A813CJN7_9DINO|nr:BUB3.2 [Symbiodinium necroappetens]